MSAIAPEPRWPPSRPGVKGGELAAGSINNLGPTAGSSVTGLTKPTKTSLATVWSLYSTMVLPGSATPNFSAPSLSSRHTFGVTGTPSSARPSASAALRSPG